MKGKNVRSIRSRYFLFYLLAGFVPLCIFFAIFRFGALAEYRKELEREYDISALRLLSEVDYRVQQLDRYASAFSNYIYGNLSDLMDVGLDSSSEYILKDLLSGYEKSFGAGMQAFYYERGSTYIYSSEGVMPYSKFEETTLRDVDLLDIPVFTMVNGENFKRIRHSHLHTFYFYPVPEYAYISMSSLVFMLDNEVLRRNSLEYFGSYEVSYEIISSDGSLIASSSPGKSLSGDDERISFHMKSETTGNSIECSALRNDVLKPFLVRKTRFNLIAFLSSAAMIAFAWMLSGISYLPIRNLMSTIGKKDRGIHRDEMKFISEHLSDMEEEKSRLEMRLESSYLMLERIIVDRLMLGELDRDDRDMDEITKGLSALFPHKLFQVLLLIPDDEESSYSKEMVLIRKYLEAFRSEGISLFLTGLSDGGALTLILNTDEDKPLCNAEEVLKALERNFEFPWKASTSLMHEDLFDLKIAYIESGIALEHARKKGLSCFDESIRSASSFIIPQISTNLFQHSMKAGDLDSSLKILDGLFEYVEESGAISVQKQGMLYDIFNLVVRTAGNMGMEGFSVRYMLSELKDPARLKVALSDAVRMVIRERNAFESRTRDDEIGDVRKYVDHNFRNRQISLSDLSDRFGYSVSTLSRLFRKEAGKGFVDYLSDLRFAWMKDELRSSDRTIKDIIGESGYTNISGTMKKFKEREGMTMMEWRDLNCHRY